MKILLVLSTLLADHAFAADVETTIRTTFVTPWIRALTSGQPEVLKRLLHPKVQACMNDETREYLNAGIEDEFRGAKADYEITKLAPWNGPPPLFTLPADSFFYPVPPTYELNLQLGQNHTVIIRYLAQTKGAWFEVEPCPNEKGIAFMRDRVALGNPAEGTRSPTCGGPEGTASWGAPRDSETAPSNGRGQEISRSGGRR